MHKQQYYYTQFAGLLPCICMRSNGKKKMMMDTDAGQGTTPTFTCLSVAYPAPHQNGPTGYSQIDQQLYYFFL